MKKFFLLISILTICWTTSSAAAQYAVARSAAPVLNSPDFSAIFGGPDGNTLKTDRCGQVRELEYIALPGTSFKLLREIRNNNSRIYQVETSDYPTPADGKLYVDSRFIELHDSQPSARTRKLPERQQIISDLRGASGSPYVWGGNVQQGVGQLSEMFYHGTRPPGKQEWASLSGSRLNSAKINRPDLCLRPYFHQHKLLPIHLLSRPFLFLTKPVA